jgi:hypothetical protein
MALFLAVGCQWITGAKERDFVPDGPPCSSSLDCDGGVCVLEACRSVCHSNGECPAGSQCLPTSLGPPACVRVENLACGGDNSCFGGTQCTDGRCRAPCEPGTLRCLDGYACVGAVCIDNTSLDSSAIEASMNGAGGTNEGGGAGSRGGAGMGGSAMGGGGGGPVDAGQMVADASDGAVSGPCGNGRKDGTETDVDCGGSSCPKCEDGLRCKVGTDCDFGTCDTNFLCGPHVWVFTQGACYVLLVRNGVVVESESSPQSVDCDPDPPRPRVRSVTDKVLVYARNPPNHAVDGNVDPPPTYYFSRCAGALTTRQELLAELNNSAGRVMSPEIDFAFPYFTMSKACPIAAVYTF